VESQRKIRDSLSEVLVHMREVNSIQRSLSDRSGASREELRRWQAELRSSMLALYDGQKTQLEI
jgi:hypothetical protein